MTVQHAIAYKTSAQSIGTSLVGMTYAAELADTIAAVNFGTSSTRFTVSSALNGRYGRFKFSAHIDAALNEGETRKNGSTFLGGGKHGSESVGTNGIGASSAPVALVAADYFEAFIRNFTVTANTSQSDRCWGELEILPPWYDGALVNKSAGQAVSAGVDTALSWNTEAYDLAGWHDNAVNNTRMTIPADVSLVRLSSNIEAPGSAGNQLVLLLHKNGGLVYGGFACDVSYAASRTRFLNGVSGPLAVAEGDYFEALVNNQVAQTIPNGNHTWFQIEQLPPDLQYALVRKSADQALSATTLTMLSFDTEVADVGGWHDNAVNNSRLTVPAGVTHVKVTFNVNGASQSEQFVANIVMNGSTIVATPTKDNDTVGQDFLNVQTAIIPVVEGDYFEAQVFSNLARNAVASLATWFSIEEVRQTDLIVTPDEGPDSGGTAITITGALFTGATGVTIGGVAATSFSVVDDSTITCVTPAGSGLGTVDVVVQRPSFNITLADGFTYNASGIETTVTQLPLLVVAVSEQPAWITQLPLLVVAVPPQPSRITQLPLSTILLLDPEAPKPLLPMWPMEERWEWQSAMSVRRNGKEQRMALRSIPVLQNRYALPIQDDAQRQRALYTLLRYVGQPIDYPLFQYQVDVEEASTIGQTTLFCDTTIGNFRVGEAVLIYERDLQATHRAVVASIETDHLVLVDPLDESIPEGYRVAPLSTCYLPDPLTVGIDHVSLGMLNLDMEVDPNRAFLRPGQSTTLEEYDGVTVLPDKYYSTGNVGHQFEAGTDRLSNDLAPPTNYRRWRTPTVTAPMRFAVQHEDLDYWRAFANAVRGRQGTFLMPSFRNDFKLSAIPDPGATTLFTNDEWVTDFFKSRAYRWIELHLDDGSREIRRVISARLNTDRTAEITLDTGVSDGVLEDVSFVWLHRLASDTVTVTHFVNHVEIGMSVTTQDQ